MLMEDHPERQTGLILGVWHEGSGSWVWTQWNSENA